MGRAGLVAGVTRTLLRLEAPALAGLELPCFEAAGASEGPHLCLLAGIHGGEYAPIAAVRDFMRALDPERLSGTITAVPLVNVPAFRARSPFVVPEDGKNLNRCFPGDPAGSFTDVLAHEVFERLIGPADVLIDVHAGDMVEALVPFSGHAAGDEKARGLALAYGLPYVVAFHESSGMTTAAAAAAGVCALLAEAGGRGLLEEDAVQLHLRGLESALRRLGMLPGDPHPPPLGMRSVERFVWLYSEHEGWWQPAVEVGEDVEAGARLGAVLDLFGDELDEVLAPEAGVPLFVTSSPAVAANGLLLGLGAGLAPAGA